MSSYKPKIAWECMEIHLPDWLRKNDYAISACMSINDLNRCNAILDRYNELTSKEENEEEDGFSIYGIEDEKWDLVNEFISLHMKYREKTLLSPI